MTDPHHAADLLLAARASAVALDVTGLECAPCTRDDVLAIQARVAEHLGPTGAWKVGAKAPDAEPAYAPIAKAGVHPSPVTLADADFAMRGIEAEIAYRLAADLPPRPTPYTRDEVAAAVDAVLPVIEIVESRLTDRIAAGPHWALADNQSHGALVVGEAVPDWRGEDVLAPHVRITFDERIAVDRECRNAAGDPFDQVVKLANLVGTHCGGLRKGQIVTTGSLMGIEIAPQRSRVLVEIGDFASVEVRFGRGESISRRPRPAARDRL